MADTTRVNFHCHSDLSDGVYAPETLASMLARDGVRYASLTDHDTIDGWARFSDSLQKRGVGCIHGVEISARLGDDEVHLLAYGFNPRNPELRHTLHVIRKQRRIGLQTVIASLRTTLAGRSSTEATQKEDHPPVRSLPPFDCGEIIRRVHAAGGLVFLAHPMTVSPDIEEVTRIVGNLKEQGLDGIEAYYPDHSADQRQSLVALARAEKLLISGGTDLHGPDETDKVRTGIEMPTGDWKDFRNALRKASPPVPGDGEGITSAGATDPRWRNVAFRFAIPATLTIALFLFAGFVLLIPALENSLMQRKRETVQNLTAVAASILREYEEKAQNDPNLSHEQAQERAKSHIRNMRYGEKGVDYFWIIDTHPRMVMHPYRPELEGEDMSGFTEMSMPGDRRKKKLLFVEAVDTVEKSKSGQGFTEYRWQYQDDETRVEPKISHVRLFRPWNWIVGTGIYTEDVRAEIKGIERHLVWSVVIIAIVVAGLLLFIVQQSLRLETARSRVETSLRESHKRYRLLVETASEGTLLLLDGRCAFANRAMLKLLDYTSEELALLDWRDILPASSEDDHPSVRYFADLVEGKPAPLEHTGQLRRKTGETVTVTLTCQSIDMDDRHGLILSVRNTGLSAPTLPAARAAAAGADPRAVVADANEDRRSLIDRLQSSLLFLNEPLSHFRHSLVTCAIDAPIGEVAKLMTRQSFSAALVLAGSGSPLGIVTDGDLRRRVLAESRDPARPIHEIMSSPLFSIGENAMVYEALLRMEEQGVRHLALRDVEGNITGVVRRADVVAFHRYASAVVEGDIRHAKSLEEVVTARERVPQVVASLVDVAARPRAITHLLATVHDVVTDRLLRMAMDRLGPPPARFAFLCMGSQGREEETLLTDQDNGIIYEDVPKADHHNAQKYFLALGDLVCQWLDTAGYRYCAGGVMARESQWCAPLALWKERFAGWINASEPQDIMRLDMCFDFRCVYGADELTHALRRFVLDRIEARPEFLGHFARNTLEYKPPLSFFGKIQVRDEGEHEKVLDVKAAMMPIVKFARLYALREKLPHLGTLPRLDRMFTLDLLSRKGHEEIVLAYEFLMDLRLRHQVRAIQGGRHPDNLIQPRTLAHIEEVTLRESLSQVALIQKRIGYDFLGVAET